MNDISKNYYKKYNVKIEMIVSVEIHDDSIQNIKQAVKDRPPFVHIISTEYDGCTVTSISKSLKVLEITKNE